MTILELKMSSNHKMNDENEDEINREKKIKF